MGKDKKKYAKIMGRLDSATQTLTLVWDEGGHSGIRLCEGGGMCYECTKYRGIANPYVFETLQGPQWKKFQLPIWRYFLNKQINEATMPWEDRKLLVDITMDEPEWPNWRPKFTVKVRVTASMKLLPFVVKDPNTSPRHKTHGVGICNCFIPLDKVISAAKSHREGTIQYSERFHFSTTK